MNGTSSNFQKLLRRLVEAVGQTPVPTFGAAELRAIDSKGVEMLRAEKILLRGAKPTELDHPVWGRVDVRQHDGRWFLVDSSNPGSDWQEVSADDIARVAFSHRGMLKWIARCCGTEDEIDCGGDFWTVGNTTVQGRWCRILYWPGLSSKDRLLTCAHSIAVSDGSPPHLLLLPVAISLGSEELGRLESRGIFVDHLYRLASGQGIDLGSARLPALSANGEPAYIFMRAASGKGWKIGFNTREPTPFADSVAIQRIWLLLRNPGKEFRASDLTDELQGVSSDRSRDKRKVESTTATIRSSGTRSRSLQDLTPEQQTEGAEIYRELGQAREEDGEDSHRFREADESWRHFQQQFGLTGTFGGKAKRESDDAAKERGTIKRSIDRWIKDRRDAGMTELADHLAASISRGPVFCYDPEHLPPWQT